MLSALSTPTTLSLDFTNAPTAYRITRSQQNDRCPSSPDTSGASPYLGYVVVNDTAQAATLSAWAVCTATDDGFLTFYQAKRSRRRSPSSRRARGTSRKGPPAPAGT